MNDHVDQAAWEELNRHPKFREAPETSKRWMCALYAHAKRAHGAGLRASGPTSITFDPNYAAFHNIRTTRPGFFVDFYREPDTYRGILTSHEPMALNFRRGQPGRSRVSVEVTDAAHLDALKRLLDRAWQLKRDKIKR